jgi:hypothetical protein
MLANTSDSQAVLVSSPTIQGKKRVLERIMSKVGGASLTIRLGSKHEHKRQGHKPSIRVNGQLKTSFLFAHHFISRRTAKAAKASRIRTTGMAEMVTPNSAELDCNTTMSS